MPNQNTLSTTILFLAFAVIGLVFAVPTRAQVLSHQQLRIDTKLALEDLAYSVPAQILVVPLFPPESKTTINDRDWFRGLYYYSIANTRRSGFTDIPFHYVVSRTGDIYKGNSGGEERKISIEGVGDNMIVIGYLAGKSDNAFDPRAEEGLSNIILDVANRNAITLDKVTVSSVAYVKNDEAQTITIQKQELFGLWNTSLQKVVDRVAKLYSPIAKTYKANIVKLEMPTVDVKPGETIVGSVTIKNTGDFGFYPDTASELLGTLKAGSLSKFYLAEFWASTSQFNLLAEDAVLLPGQEKKFDFRVNVPLYFGAQSEEYQLYTISGQPIEGAGLTLTLNVTKPEGITIVEIKPTETGWLRVRATPSSVAGEIARVSAGERFYQTEDAGNGWVKIKLNDGQEGWVSRQYLVYP